VPKITNELERELKQLKNLNQRAFLLHYYNLGMISKAAQQAGIHRRTHYTWLEQDPEYAAIFTRMREEVTDLLEEEAWRRAREGVTEDVFYRGEKVGEITRYSDTLLIFLLKGANPRKYAEFSKHEITGDGLKIVIDGPEADD